MLNYDKLAKEVFDSLNKARTTPTAFVPLLQAKVKQFKGNTLYKPGEIPLMTNEGPGAVIETIEFLQSHKPLPALVWSDSLARAAQDHANDIGPSGVTSHTGSDGSSMSDRIERYGDWMGKIAENIDFGSSTADEIVMSLMIDDGNMGRGHRKNIFQPEHKVAGVACNSHKQYAHCCVQDFASELSEKGKGQKATIGSSNLNSFAGFKDFQMPQQFGGGFPSTTQKADPFQDFGKMGAGFGGFSGGLVGTDPFQAPVFKTSGGSHAHPHSLSHSDPDAPPGTVSTSISKQTTTKNGVSHTKETKTYKLADGSTQVIVKEY